MVAGEKQYQAIDSLMVERRFLRCRVLGACVVCMDSKVGREGGCAGEDHAESEEGGATWVSAFQGEGTAAEEGKREGQGVVGYGFDDGDLRAAPH